MSADDSAAEGMQDELSASTFLYMAVLSGSLRVTELLASLFLATDLVTTGDPRDLVRVSRAP